MTVGDVPHCPHLLPHPPHSPVPPGTLVPGPGPEEGKEAKQVLQASADGRAGEAPPGVMGNGGVGATSTT